MAQQVAALGFAVIIPVPSPSPVLLLQTTPQLSPGIWRVLDNSTTGDPSSVIQHLPLPHLNPFLSAQPELPFMNELMCHFQVKILTVVAHNCRIKSDSFIKRCYYLKQPIHTRLCGPNHNLCNLLMV